MITQNRITTALTLAVVAMAGVVLSGTSANAAPFVYEGFQYAAVNDSLHGQPDDLGVTDTDATGLTGTWADTTGATGNMFVKLGNLSFGDLPTTGNHVGYLSNANNDIFNRALTTEAQTGISGASEIWFSILFEKLQNNFSAGEGGFALANQTVGNPRIYLNDGTDGLAGFGFAPTTDGNDLTPYAWDGSSVVVGDATISVPPNNGSSNTDGSNLGPVHLIVGEISLDTGAGGTDEYTLYDYTLNAGSVVGGTLNPIGSTLEVNVNQGDLAVVNLTRQVNLNYDELRIGTTLEDVVGGGGGSSFIAGDYNSSDQVEQGDLDLVLLNWGDSSDPAPNGWTNPDFQPTPDSIDQDDLDGVLLNWGNTAAVATSGVVPEPASACLLLIGGLLLGRLRRNG